MSLFGVGIEKTFFGGSQLLTTIAVSVADFPVQKNTREFCPRVSLKFETNFRASLLLLPPG